MNTNLPVPERTLPRESADRIRSAIVFAEPEPDRRASRWLLGLAAAVVVIALLATAALLWPGASRTQVVATPTPTPALTSAEPTPMATGMPTPTPAPSRTGPLQPGPKQDPLDTDRGGLTNKRAVALIEECNAPIDGVEQKMDVEKMLYARRTTDGRRNVDVAIFRRTNGEEWLCAPVSMQVSVDEFAPEIGPNSTFPVITDSGQGSGLDQDGATSEWIFRALSSVDRIQVRAVVDDRPRRWFEAEVHGGFAYLPVFTPGSFTWDDDVRGAGNITYEQRAFDVDGREVPVRVMEMPR